MASGIEVAMITVERQLPRNSRIIRLVSTAAITASKATPGDRALDEQRLVAQRREVRFSGSVLRSSATLSLMPAMMASVEVAPFFSTCSRTERLPSTWTMLVCGGLPSRTWATSRR